MNAFILLYNTLTTFLILFSQSLCNACGIKYRKQEEKIKKQKEVVEQDDAALVHAGAAVDNKSDGSCTTLNDCY